MSTVAENCWVMQIKQDQLITHNIKKCQTIFFRKQIKGNDSQWLETTFKYLVRYPLGEIIVCDARSLHACMHDIFMLQLTFEIWHLHAISSGEHLLIFLKSKAFAHCSTEILVFTPWSKMLVATFSVNHVCPFKYRTCHSEIKQNSDFNHAWRKLKKENKMPLINHEIAQKQSLYNDLFTDSRKDTFRMWKTTEKWHFIS